MCINDRILIAEFGGDVYGNRNPGQPFDHVPSDQAGVHGGSACSDHDPVNILEYLIGNLIGGKVWHAAHVSRCDRIFQSLRLLVYFFHHKMVIAAFFGSAHIPAYVMDRGTVDVAVLIFYDDLVFGYDSDMFFL